jgi:superfamily II DNA or RNA helicase
MAMTDDRRLRQQLIHAYETLAPLDQAILQLLSVIYDGVTKSPLLDCVRRCHLPLFELKSLTMPGLTTLLNRLLGTKVIVKSNNQLRCHPLLAEEATRQAIQDGRFEAMAAAVQQAIKIPGWDSDYPYFYTYRQCLRELRIAFHRRDTRRAQRILEVCARQFPSEYHHYPPWLLIFNNPFSAEGLRALPDELLEEALATIFTAGVRDFEPAIEALALAEALVAENRCVQISRYYLAEHCLLCGESARARQYLDPDDTDHGQALRGWLAFLEGTDEGAIQHYETALKLLRQRTRKRKIFFDHLAGVFFILALLASGSAARLRQAAEAMAPTLDKNAHYPFALVYRSLLEVVEIQQGSRKEPTPLSVSIARPAADRFFQLLALFWLNAAEPQTLREPTEILLNLVNKTNYRWIEAELTDLSQRLRCRQDDKAAPSERQVGNDGRGIVQLFRRKEPWEHALSALLDVSAGQQQPTAATTQLRLVWWLRWHENGYCVTTPREQKRDARGLWTRGRPVALKRLYSRSERLDFLTPQDVEVCAAIRPNYAGYYGGTSYELDHQKALPLLVGHPLLFWEDAPGVRVELVRGEPELLIVPHGSQWRLELSPKALPGETLKVVKETPTRLKVIAFNEAHQRILTILGEGLLVPASAEARVLETVAALSNLVTVQSSVGAGVDNLEEVAAEPLPHIHLLPFGTGLKIELLVKPFAAGGPYYRPGVGGERVIAEIDGRRLQTRRDLRLERQRAAQVVKATPTLSRQPTVGGEWLLADPETCLEALLELQALGNRAVLEWPEGERFKIGRQTSLDQLRLNIKRQQDWFEFSGELRLEDDLVLDLRRLLELAEQAPGRFVPLGEGRFLALTREFRQRLEEIGGLGEPTAKGVRLHPLVALTLETFAAEARTVKGDADWKAHLQRLREAETLQATVPSTLQAELRDYQVEGFQWLTRLAHWGVGACLADDMGLGKTVQALALILNRAQDGPTLVVAPTSVCLNWLDEARRFAPTLNAGVFGAGDREQTLARLGAFDLLVCSYGLLQQEAERLAQIQWRTLVLDEAQAIKNPATKRSQAALALRGDFKMILTGTPVENHLGELWNLFRFINPGLLGSLEHFNQRFAIPIERDQDARARHRLKKSIQPFILRRLKSEVLEALPSRTEILRRVELGPEEMALYEALRQQALARLAKSDEAEGQKSLQILAEIMKLRRACCHPSLALPDTDLSGTKLAVFEDILDELLENRHKALVFSQFVDHLAILRAALERKGVAYQYLDGGTPGPERKQRVDAFQAGHGDVFLISLKAGGLGLNLTAADYVIHMDPWWNPAVEDQASDRAHRIGQQRPVTIYRLVAQGTIEEKIVALHHQKRDLAERLLEGTGASGKISTEELLELLQQG